jgi:vitamin B12 transporter
MTRVIGGLGIVLMAVMATFPVSAQERTEPVEVKRLEPVVVTATKTPTLVEQTGSSVTVIDEATIERRQETDLLQILRDQPGFSLIQTGGRGGVTSIFTRGGNSDMNLVLIDGMKVNQGGGAFDFADTTTIGLRRVEIVRGPQSALYGADALTSVIQFFTPRGEGPFSAWGFAGGGNYGTHEERVGLSWGNKFAGVFFEFGNAESSGILDVNSDYRNRTSAVRLDLSPTPDLDLTLTGRYVASRFGVATESAGDRFDVLDPHQFSQNERFVGTLGAAYRQTSWLEHRAKVGVNLTTSNFVDPRDNVPFDAFSPPEGTRTLSKEERILLDYNAVLSAPRFWNLTPVFVVGGSYEHQNFTQRSHPVGLPNRTNVERETWSGYGQLQLSWLDHVFLTAGGRYDDSTAFGEELTPRVSLAVVMPVTRTRLRGAYGTGIKEPSFFAQFGGFGIPGNPGIKSEKSESWEVGVDQPLFGKLVEVGVTYFENRFEDLIAFVSFTEGSKNIQAVKTHGVEFVGTLRPFHGWTVAGSYTFLETEVTDDGGIGGQNTFPKGEPLLRRPRHSGSVSVGYQRDRFQASATLFVKGDSIDRNFNSPGSPRVTLPGYEKLDLAVGWTLFRNVVGLQDVTWKTRFSNVLNERYEEVFGFSSPRLSVLTGIEVRY